MWWYLAQIIQGQFTGTTQLDSIYIHIYIYVYMHVFNNNTTHTISERKLSSTRSAQTVRILAQRWEPMRWQKKKQLQLQLQQIAKQRREKTFTSSWGFFIIEGGR